MRLLTYTMMLFGLSLSIIYNDQVAVGQYLHINDNA
jgi:hypothetical protein